MKWIIVGLGNPGGEYAKTRHNAGRIVLDLFRESHDLPLWEMKKSYKALVSKGEVVGRDVLLLEPETYMNESGKSLTTLVKSKKQAAQLIVIHDDIDLPLGAWKLSFNRGSGGHNGIESIALVLKTKEFIRIRIGVAPRDDDGAMRKPKGEEAVVKFVLGKFREEEHDVLARVSKEVIPSIEMLLSSGLEKTMNTYN
ncbi:MAG: aminoacyl-tRNA hydrolase [Candidatus Lloydbacteria bacterium RIFOXYC12_FULL_46_25]|uniref:Peptidyl-tRNA hydrolase n=1 Tax=Candidatus Lloydbacteria bacterium RIFOXYC12_FULL_46_25 TaxID=1798670 RepID=A0A1G2E6V0_9BACT|nr:MAG: aminoacyl-tRNA hydrolase [Candidatus Lloydbacteria bacterium RIFOXYC12_FULL_46_25]